jgi:molybdopterin-guanine dinucleotide biosynthesis protein A
MLSLVIQAGGQSKRMGKDKGLVSFLDKPLIQHVIDRLAPLADEIVITTNQPEDYRFLGYRLEPDLLPGRGALGGLYTALSKATYPLAAVVACDMPFANPQILTAGCNWLSDETFDAAVPNTTGGIEPFHAVYRRKSCLPAIKAALDAGQWRADSWFSTVNIRLIPASEILRYDPAELAFWNVNTPEELFRAEERAKSL